MCDGDGDDGDDGDDDGDEDDFLGISRFLKNKIRLRL